MNGAAELQELINLLSAAGQAAFMVFLRIGAMVWLMPAFGEQSVPVRVKLVVGLSFTAVVLPMVLPLYGPPRAGADMLLAGGSEVAVGLFFGLSLRFFVFSLQTAGTIAAQSTSLSQMLGASAGSDPAPAMAHMLTLAGLTLAVMMGLHLRLVEFLVDSYDMLPPGTWPTPGEVAEAGVARAMQSLILAFSLAAPFVLAGLAYNVIIGVINRAMPQLMVTFIGAPAATFGGLILLLISAPLLLPIWLDALFAFMASPFAGP